MRALASGFDTVFQQTGIWLWFVHAAMSLVFAGLLGAMWARLRRPLVGWLAAFFGSHIVVALAVATYWRGGMESPVASATLAMITGGGITALVPISLGAFKTLRSDEPLHRRTLVGWIAAGVAYAFVAALLILQRTDRPDLVVTAAFRPLALVSSVGPLLVFRSIRHVLPINQSAAEALRLGLLANLVFSVAEAFFRTRVGVADDPAFPLTATVVNNLMGLLTLGISALLATILQGRAELLAALEREMLFNRREAHAARLESLGRLAAGIANEFNRLFADAHTHLSSARTTWYGDPDRAVVEMEGVRTAVERGTQVTTSLLRLARQQDTTPRRMSPVTRVRELLPVLSRIVGEEQGVRTELTASHDVHMAPAQFDQVMLNVLLAVMETAPPEGTLCIALHDMQANALDAFPFDTASSSGWIRLRVSCDSQAMDREDEAVSTPALSRSAAWRLARRDLGAALGQASAQLVHEAAGGHVRVVSGDDGEAAVDVWLPAVAAAAARPAYAPAALDESSAVRFAT